MRFNLEPGGAFCDGKNKLVTVKINDKERISLPTKAYFSYGYRERSMISLYAKIIYIGLLLLNLHTN
ncbi:hypothetical protein EJB00_03205 [Wolbachia endosymbiont of Drosophila mauritiana]|uniref:hypothetical protein n=1 Tax=unclassified Wolbachia TaxID=2640676 RepID=UPI0003A35945|nr:MULTISPECIES: hypothetical protein [unclassified Wolbachia]QCB62621.1 hypothetical protein EJA99_03215 [Wolbachia endosymbiont of Drosophila mauritiana]QCB63666.1 hypothetical protein EJB00_03205 [Wolbachia endosymbiont of Drosophila mauritiana]TGB06956.1 hypothetical protein E5C28_02275 [Wolbachia endosymbiont of Drosophila mauritiana]